MPTKDVSSRMPRRLTRGIVLNLLAASALMATVSASQAEKLRVTIADYSANTMPYFKAMAEAFRVKNPSTTIEFEIVPFKAMQQKLTTDISAGVNSDLAVIGTRWLVDYVSEGITEPLDGYMDKEFKARFFPAFLEPSVIKGKTYGLPMAASVRAMFYNKDILAKAGINAPPANWDDFIAATKAVKALGDKDVRGFGLQGRSQETDIYFYYPMWAYGGNILTADGKSGVNSDAGLKALKIYKSLIDDGLTQPGVTDYDRSSTENLFKQGKVAMMFSGPFLTKQFAEQAPNLNYGIAPIPAGSQSATYGVTDTIMMFANSKVKKEAWAFLDFLFATEQRVAFDKAEGFLPVNVEEAKMPQFANNPSLQVFAAMLPSAKFVPLVAGWDQIANTTTGELQAAYLGQATPEVVLKRIETKINAVLGK